jgi:BirA family transcriptional regulator, biotin operon repressor / biotin---[acetyl-CoA-carboxylase] ligase|tara:strand:- start:15671 stop:16402 length:732 start_codon:yes stop_codon:yes gene_type:complete
VDIIKLNAIDSTNSYLLNLSRAVHLEDPTIVITNNQTKGRGQHGTSWQSVPQQSLLFSVFKRFEDLPSNKIPNITYAVSLGLENAFKKYKIPNITIKWPNDIMSRSKKMAGILIENQIKQGNVVSSVIGLGINVNEKKFKSLPQATSMLLTTGNKFNLNEVLQLVIEEILIQLTKLDKGDYADLKIKYETSLFRKDMISVFEVKDGYRFNGKIKGVNEIGKIVIENENEILNSYQLKEIKMLF